MPRATLEIRGRKFHPRDLQIDELAENFRALVPQGTITCVSPMVFLLFRKNTMVGSARISHDIQLVAAAT